MIARRNLIIIGLLLLSEPAYARQICPILCGKSGGSIAPPGYTAIITQNGSPLFGLGGQIFGLA